MFDKPDFKDGRLQKQLDSTIENYNDTRETLERVGGKMTAENLDNTIEAQQNRKETIKDLKAMLRDK